ncbi:hypothetical protein U9M48_044124 [Paspalum notatum var. saurae]|uniref:CCHC-type domain-containing protein n=1 Tax=Paspalum notatum var. saurae TaxID=547442 RepID=A0AAQ3V0P4_PASNO
MPRTPRSPSPTRSSQEPSSLPSATPASASTLNPNALPFLGFTAGSSERVRLSASPLTLSDEDLSDDDGYVSPSFLEAVQRKGKQVAAPSPSMGNGVGRADVVPPSPRRGGFMADARRTGDYRLREGHRSVGAAAEDGWTTVVHRRGRPAAHRGPYRAPRPSRPVPPELDGRCFNCLSWDHVAAACRAASRCFRCNDEGHQAKDCWRQRRRRRRLLRSPAQVRSTHRWAVSLSPEPSPEVSFTGAYEGFW